MNEEFMKQFIGKDIIRVKPTKVGGKNFLEYPVNLKGIEDGRLIVKASYGTKSEEDLQNDEYKLVPNYTDKNWVLYKDVLKTENQYLSKIGKILVNDLKEKYQIIALNRYFMVLKSLSTGKCEIKNLSISQDIFSKVSE